MRRPIAEAGEWADSWRVASDMGFLEARYRELGAADAEADVVRTAERRRATGDASYRGHREALVRALGRESHWLRVALEATAALVWNRLRRSGWSAVELARQLQIPVNAHFLRVRHVATHESSALERTLRGHAGLMFAGPDTLIAGGSSIHAHRMQVYVVPWIKAAVRKFSISICSYWAFREGYK